MRVRTLVGVLLAFTLVAAACGDDDDAAITTAPPETVVVTSIVEVEVPGETVTSVVTETVEVEVEAENPFEGTTVTVFGPESSDVEAGALQSALDLFAAQTGINIEYTGARDFSDQINAQAVGGNPPDIAVFPQPGKIADFAREDLLAPLPSDVEAVMNDNFSSAWTAFGNVDGTQYAIPTKADLKSLVWYRPADFAAGGYAIPESWADLKALGDTMIADGNTPWCIGIESGPATGWTFTDWVEDLMLRFHGPDVYDQWVAHEIPFNDARVTEVWNEILGVWNTPGGVFAANGSIAATPFGANGEPLVNGDCMMHRQASFFSAFFPEGTPTGPDGVDVFYFPAVGDDRPVLGAGTLVSAFRDAPEVWEVMKYFASSAYADARQNLQHLAQGGGTSLSGYLSPNLNKDLGEYQPLEQSFLEFLDTASVVRFDGSDLMPATVGAGSFWVEATSAVNGDKSVDDAMQTIEDSWP
ncbi:MAG: ABC transporter substrate-binding protein [Acidimicrobiia bacterium]